nr:unnamed protein product [Digitaria exilis]
MRAGSDTHSTGASWKREFRRPYLRRGVWGPRREPYPLREPDATPAVRSDRAADARPYDGLPPPASNVVGGGEEISASDEIAPRPPRRARAVAYVSAWRAPRHVPRPSCRRGATPEANGAPPPPSTSRELLGRRPEIDGEVQRVIRVCDEVDSEETSAAKAATASNRGRIVPSTRRTRP